MHVLNQNLTMLSNTGVLVIRRPATVPFQVPLRRIKNPWAALHTPFAVCRPDSVPAVQQCVAFARRHGLRLTVLGGGALRSLLAPGRTGDRPVSSERSDRGPSRADGDGGWRGDCGRDQHSSPRPRDVGGRGGPAECRHGAVPARGGGEAYPPTRSGVR